MTAGRARQIAALAQQFRDYLAQQTDTDMPEIEAVATDHGLGASVAFARLDAALALLLDLASVYDEAPRGVLEPLVLPTAALAGEYLRAAGLGTWHDPDDDDSLADDALIIVAGPTAVDLTGVARAALASERPNLSAVAQRLAELAA